MGEELKERLSKLIKLSITPPSPPPFTLGELLRSGCARAVRDVTQDVASHTHTHTPKAPWIVMGRGRGGHRNDLDTPRRVVTPVECCCVNGGAVAF